MLVMKQRLSQVLEEFQPRKTTLGAYQRPQHATTNRKSDTISLYAVIASKAALALTHPFQKTISKISKTIAFKKSQTLDQTIKAVSTIQQLQQFQQLWQSTQPSIRLKWRSHSNSNGRLAKHLSTSYPRCRGSNSFCNYRNCSPGNFKIKLHDDDVSATNSRHDPECEIRK